MAGLRAYQPRDALARVLDEIEPGSRPDLEGLAAGRRQGPGAQLAQPGLLRCAHQETVVGEGGQAVHAASLPGAQTPDRFGIFAAMVSAASYAFWVDVGLIGVFFVAFPALVTGLIVFAAVQAMAERRENQRYLEEHRIPGSEL